MIETFIIEYLNKMLDVPVYAEEPHDKKSYVLVERTGGTSDIGISTATIAIQSYGEELTDAIKLNKAVKRAMTSIDDQNPVSKATLNTDYNYTDTTTKRYRYQAIYDLTYYEED